MAHTDHSNPWFFFVVGSCIIGSVIVGWVGVKKFNKPDVIVVLLISGFSTLGGLLVSVVEPNQDDGLIWFFFCIMAIVASVTGVVVCRGCCNGCFSKCQDITWDKTAGMVLIYCAAVGFIPFTCSVVVFTCGFAGLFCLVSIVIWCGKSSWDDEQDEPDHRSTVGNIALLLTGSAMRVANFVVQVSLVTYSFGDLWQATRHIELYLKAAFAILATKLPAIGKLMELGADISSYLNEIAASFSSLLLDFSSIWSPDMIIAYISIAVFEIAVVTAVFVVVLSDVMLIVSPRDGAGCMGRLVGDFVSRAILYVLQAMVGASHSLLFALFFVTPLERSRPSHDESSGWDGPMTVVAVLLTLFYFGVTVLTGVCTLYKLWSGNDVGLQNGAVWLMEKNGISLPQVTAKSDSPCAFLLAFFGIWPQHVLDAFEVRQRTQNYRLQENDVLLATVNALSFPLYLVPFGTIVAKLGEYLNQNPIYVESRGFSFWGLLITLTFVAEYVLVLVVAKEAMMTIEAGLAEEAEVKEAAGQGGHSLVVVSFCLLALTLARALFSATRDCHEGGHEGGEESEEELVSDEEHGSAVELEWSDDSEE